MLENKYTCSAIYPQEYEKWFDRFYVFMEEFIKTCPPSHRRNYEVENWKSSNSSFLKNVYVDRRYDSGFINVAQCANKIIGISACHEYKSDVIYLGSRTSILPGYEADHLGSSLLIPMQQQAFKENYKFGIITFNRDQYSRRLMLSLAKRDKWTSSKVLRLTGLEYCPFTFITDRTFNIFNCEQYVAFCSLTLLASKEEFMSTLG